MKCPHCTTAFHENWNTYQFPTNSNWIGRHLICPECGQFVLRLEKYHNGKKVLGPFFAYPRTSGRPPVPNEVPEEFAQDYREACLVFSDSPKASAALSRRLLQHIIREKAGIKEKDLAKEIEKLIDFGKIPSHLSAAVDGVRNIGNFAAHPIKSTNTGEVVDVEPGEAEWLLDTLEGFFDFYFVQPAILQKKRDELNAKLAEAGKPPMK
jgi:hypothetical protein